MKDRDRKIDAKVFNRLQTDPDFAKAFALAGQLMKNEQFMLGCLPTLEKVLREVERKRRRGGLC